MIIVSDTSPLSSLFLIGRLDLLPEIFGEIIVPEKSLDLLIDEMEGRNIAAVEGLKTIGILGVFIQAKSMGLIQQVRPLMDDLRVLAKFYLHDKLYQAVLRQAGEG